MLDYKGNWFLTIIYPLFLPRPAIKILIIPQTPLLLLDFDGVINVKNHLKNAFRTLNKVLVYGGTGDVVFDIRYDKNVITFLNEISKTIEIQWLSMWHHMARYRIGPLLGLNDFSVYPIKKGDLIKKPYFRKDILSRPIIWIDDKLNDPLDMMGPFNYMKMRAKRGILGIAPRGNVGLTSVHMKMIRQFINH
jgi:hypothetical protein